MLRLRSATPPEWIDHVLGDFSRFLADHAACERKAAATAMALIARHPERALLVEPLTALACEELDHFRRVHRLMAEHGVALCHDEPDRYAAALLVEARRGEKRLLDRLLVAGLIEARSCERLGLVAAALPPGAAKELYLDLTRAEARHHALFASLARECFEPAEVDARLDELLEVERVICAAQPLRAAVH